MRVEVFCEDGHPRIELGFVDTDADPRSVLLVRGAGIYGYWRDRPDAVNVEGEPDGARFRYEVSCPLCGGQRRHIPVTAETMTRVLTWWQGHADTPGEVSLPSLRILAHNSDSLPHS